MRKAISPIGSDGGQMMTSAPSGDVARSDDVNSTQTIGMIAAELGEGETYQQSDFNPEKVSEQNRLCIKFAALSANPDYIAHSRALVSSKTRPHQANRARSGWWLLPAVILGVMAWGAFLSILI